MNSDMIFQLIDKAEKIEIFKKIRVVDNTDLYQGFDFSVNKNSFVVSTKLKVEANLNNIKTEGYFLQFYVNGSKAPFFVSEDFLLSKELIEAMDKKKKTLAEMEQNKELERDRALVESLVTGEDSVAKLFKHTASEIVRGMNACEEKLTKKQEEQLAHIARMVMGTNIKS